METVDIGTLGVEVKLKGVLKNVPFFFFFFKNLCLDGLIHGYPENMEVVIQISLFVLSTCGALLSLTLD